MPTPREERERLETETLAPYAARSAESRGRERAEDPCPIRAVFQRDRDRIIHSKAFRRLTYKTQVFIAPEADHFRNRLTHTLEVAQIARTIARALRLNEDLTEAIALGHDLGHTPFGHAGEGALEKAYRRFDRSARFHHAEQSVRVVEVLEKDGRGLNLTWEVRNGIGTHSKGMEDLPKGAEAGPGTLEGWVVVYADRIAYVNHDIDDALRAGLLTSDSLPGDCIALLGDTHARRITTMVTDVVSHSQGEAKVVMGSDVLKATNQLKDFLFARVYQGSANAQAERVEHIIDALFRHYMARPDEVPGGAKAAEDDGKRLARAVCDHLAGMTDRFASQQFQTHFLPQRWPAP